WCWGRNRQGRISMRFPRFHSRALQAGALAALATLLPGPASSTDLQFTLGGVGGKTTWSQYVNMQRDPLFGARVGVLLRGRFGIEGEVSRISSNTGHGVFPWVNQ